MHFSIHSILEELPHYDAIPRMIGYVAAYLGVRLFGGDILGGQPGGISMSAWRRRRDVVGCVL